ncbi:cytochrome P450 [Nemania abortiva]|nr:cytochrome P450 [Nemania abortiva]
MAGFDLVWVVASNLLLIVLSYIIGDVILTVKSTLKYSQHPVVSNLWTLAPRFLLNLSFANSASAILEKGYHKFKTCTFQIVRGQGNAVVLPLSMLEELAAIPASIASPHAALEHDLLGPYTGLDLILESRIHHTIVQRKLTPRLNLLTSGMESELRYAFEKCFSSIQTGKWTEFQPYQIFGNISARLTGRALVGPRLCRDEVWLDIAFNYTENLFRTIVILRLLPPWMQPLVCVFLPSFWKGKYYVRRAKKLLRPILQELLNEPNASSPGTYDPNTSNVMHWLAELAKGPDRSADTIAHIEVLLSLASVHTTLLRMVNVLYDITSSGSELVEELREEIAKISQSNTSWEGNLYDKLHKLDSVLRESQRMSPPTILGMKRLFKADYIFNNGVAIPKGTYVCMPTFAIENDAEHTENPAIFDGLRSYRALVGSEEGRKSDSYLFTSTERTALNFGYGKSACPGRFFAGLIIKMLFVKLLTEFDFKFLPNTQRPSNLMVHEFLFCWPWQKMLVRRRKDAFAVI